MAVSFDFQFPVGLAAYAWYSQLVRSECSRVDLINMTEM